MPPKIKGFNLISKKYPSIPIKDHIKHWKIYPGDTVTIMDGKDAGKTGKVIAQVKKLNAVMVVKHVKPNPEQVKGARITRESPIPLSKVSLLDPSLNKPTDVELVKVFNPVKRKLEWNRISTLSQSLMPIPEKEDPFAKKEEGKLDTKPSIVNEVTWTPSISVAPFPVPLLNELERHRRKNKESHVL